MEDKFRVEVRVYKNRHYPHFGSGAYSMEGHSVLIPYGKKHKFKSSKAAEEFAKSRINNEAISMYDEISLTTWRGYGGKMEYIKRNSHVKNDAFPINKEFLDNLYK